MKSVKIKLDLEQDASEIFTKTLNHTSSGHYLDTLIEMKCGGSLQVDLASFYEKECYKTLWKLHWQFAHPLTEKLVTLEEHQCLG